jgi:hypothetical protein
VTDSTTHVETDAANRAHFVLCQGTQQPLHHLLLPRLLPGIQDRAAGEHIHLDSLPSIGREAHVLLRVDGFADQGRRGRRFGEEPHETGIGGHAGGCDGLLSLAER